MAVFTSSDEKAEGAVLVWLALVEEAGCIAVGKVVLCEGVAAVCEPLKDGL